MRVFYTVRGLYERIRRVLSFVPVLWKSVDYDYSGVYHVTHHALKRLHHAMATSKVHDFHNLRDIKAAIKCLENELTTAHNDHVDQLLTAKYGESKIEFIKIEGSDRYRMVDTNPNRCTPEFIAEFTALHEIAEKRRARDLKLFGKLWKRSARWWD